jgi:hypothetical protein
VGKGQLYELWDGAVERSRVRLNAALAKGGLDQPVQLAHPDGRHANLRRLVCDLIEEYGRHTGHADLLRAKRSTGGSVKTRPRDGARSPATLASPDDGHSPVQKAAPVFATSREEPTGQLRTNTHHGEADLRMGI